MNSIDSKKAWKVKRIVILIALMIIIVSVTSVLLASMAHGMASREITIVAKDMVFSVQSSESSESSGEANPTITVKRGQKVTITLRNNDAGMLHDLLIEGLEVRLETVSFGETTRLTFTVTSEPGEYVYLCSFHPRRMRGVFIVQ